MKNNRSGQAALLSESEYSKIRRCIKSKKYKLLLDIAYYTGERWGAIVKLRITDVYYLSNHPLEEITFQAKTRKASPSGERKTRQVPIHPTLREVLQEYKPDAFSQYLFPGRKTSNHLTLRNADLILRTAVQKAGLESRGISTHSTRRSFITKLHNAGVGIATIQRITGHRDIKTLNRYIEVSPSQIKSAISLI